MGKSAKRQVSQPSPSATTKPIRWTILGPAILFVVTLACYWVPMTSSQTSILWDAADYYQIVQNYFSQELHAGHLPFWTPYPWSGYPFLADPQVGAWYPLNWPFFLIGVSPHVLVVEHWLHALLASLGAYYLALRLLRHPAAAVFTGLAYGLSGFYVGHSSHTTMLQCAAWTPWLLLLLDRALDGAWRRNLLLGGVAAGMMILAGHFQTILYSCLALGLYAIARAIRDRRLWTRALGLALAMPLIGTLIAAIAVGPGLELTAQSVRASLSAITRTEGLIPLKAFATLVYPNFWGLFSGNYQGPQDVTQFYFYAGILLVPLAILGLRRAETRWAGVLLFVVPAWYAMGHSARLYLLMARLPGFSSVRAPVNIWFVPSLGLALLAGAGVAWIGDNWKQRWIVPAVLAIACVDLFYFQSAINPLAYGRESYESVYGPGEDLFRKAVMNGLPPLTRFDAPEHLPAFGPMSHFFALRTEVTYGYGPMPFARYHDYIDAMGVNPKLRNGLNVERWLDASVGAVKANPDFLPRANFPKAVRVARSEAESGAALATLDQRAEAIAPVAVAAQDGNGSAEVREFTGGSYRIHYHCASPSLLRVGSAYFPGWTATAGGRELAVVPVDHALMGVVVPAGDGEVELRYRSTYFTLSALISLLTLALCCGLLCWSRKADTEPRL